MRAMLSKLQATVHQREAVTYVKLAGVIDEDNDLVELGKKLGVGTTIIDAADVERINSCGVRDWVNWLSSAEKRGARLILVECSPAIVAQINLVHNFTGQGVVKSFYAPYFCPHCEREKVLLVETRDMSGSQPFKAPTCRCDECDGPMEFDDMEESYFAFLANAKKVMSDARVETVIEEFTPTDGERKLRSRPGSNPSVSRSSASFQSSSLPSVPSLPELAATGTGPRPITARANGQGRSGSLRTSAALAELEARRAESVPISLEPGRSGAAWVAVALLMLLAVALLAYVVFGGGAAG